MREAIILHTKDGMVSLMIDNIKDMYQKNGSMTQMLLNYPIDTAEDKNIDRIIVDQSISEITRRINEIKQLSPGKIMDVPMQAKSHEDGGIDYFEFDHWMNDRVEMDIKLESMRSSLSMIEMISIVVFIAGVIFILIKVLP